MTNTIRDVKVNDIITVEKSFKVTSIDNYEGTVSYSGVGGGRKCKVATGAYGNAPEFKITKIDRPDPGPANWPPKAGEVWQDNAEVKYMITANVSGTAIAYTANGDHSVMLNDLKAKPGIKRVWN